MAPRLLSIVLVLFTVAGFAPATVTTLPARPDSLKFAVIGDSGTGEPAQYEVGARMAEVRTLVPFDMVIMLGDNMYGSQGPQDFVQKFQRPYAALLGAGVRFYASLGNHDNPANRSYPGFNMAGERYYQYVKRNARFFALDTNELDPKQLAWFERALQQSSEDWKICYFHYPLYSNAGRHGSNVELRVTLEPLLVKYSVNVVFSGHDHTYERLKPQKGITYFVNGSSGKIRKGDIRPSATTAAHFDEDQVFSLVEIAGDELFFEARTRSGRTVDSGVINRLVSTRGGS